MEKKIIHLGKICLLSAGVMASAAMLTACSQEVAVPTAGSGDGTRVEVTASFQPLENAALTRAADGLDDEARGFSLTTSEDGGSKVRVMVDKNNGSYTTFDYDITGAKVIAAPDPAPTFPSGVNSVNVYGWYPAKSLENFSVAADQSGEADYCLSDLMWANSTTCTRVGATVNKSAALSFVHVMSKVKVSLTLAAGVTVKAVKLKNVKPTVTVSATTSGSTVTGYTTSGLTGTAGDITLLSGGSLTATSAAAEKVLCGVFPPQDINGALLEITANYNGGSDQTITYSLEAAKTFATNREYTMNISLSGTSVKTGTVTLSDWDATEGIVNLGIPILSKTVLDLKHDTPSETITVTGGTTYTAASADTRIATVNVVGSNITVTGVNKGSTYVLVQSESGNCAVCKVSYTADIRDNPLWWVAQYNVQSSGVFATKHSLKDPINSSINAPVWSYDDAKNVSAGFSSMGYHQPDLYEQVSIIPSNTNSADGTEIESLTNTMDSPYEFPEIACKVGTRGTADTSTGANVAASTSVFYKAGNRDYYAVRFIGTRYASAWHYKWTSMTVGDETVIGELIESYLVPNATTLAEAKELLKTIATAGVFTGTPEAAAANQTPVSGTATYPYFCQRFLPACGLGWYGTGLADGFVGSQGTYWSSTLNTYAFRWQVLRERWIGKTYGCSVRLFRNAE